MIALRQQLRFTVARRRWTRVSGRVVDTRCIRLRDDGTEVHAVPVAYPTSDTEVVFAGGALVVGLLVVAMSAGML